MAPNFSAHLTAKAIKIYFSAPLHGRAIIKSCEYFLFADLKYSSVSLPTRWPALSWPVLLLVKHSISIVELSQQPNFTLIRIPMIPLC